MDYFKLLPVEALVEICSWLNPKDIISLSQTCHKLNKITLDEKLWTHICCNEFGLNIPSATGFARRFYKNVLHPYGKYLGLWSKKVNVGLKDYCSCLIQISYADGQLIGVELQPPKIPHVMQPARPKTLFTISMDESKEDKAVVKCCINLMRPHLCELLSNEQNSLHIRCPESAVLRKEHDINGIRPTLQQYEADHLDFTALPSMVFTTRFIISVALEPKFRVLLTNSSYGSHFSRLQFLPPPKFPVPIKPGIFKGTDGMLGIQFVKLSYEDENTAICQKITGDAYVHAGGLSFKADLRSCFYFGHGESQSEEHVVRRKPVDSKVKWSELPKPQPFLIPQLGSSLYPHGSTPDYPNECLSRFDGMMKSYAPEYLMKTHFIYKGHWVIFNENLFGFLAIRYGKYLSMWNLYHRVQELRGSTSHQQPALTIIPATF